MLIKEAKKVCPEAVIVLGEDLTRFRNASKQLYAFLKAYSWNNRVERLGFDEVSAVLAIVTSRMARHCHLNSFRLRQYLFACLVSLIMMQMQTLSVLRYGWMCQISSTTMLAS
jgi:nucleotidyltransferase/DNA polymerase involved in DNA repair